MLPAEGNSLIVDTGPVLAALGQETEGMESRTASSWPMLAGAVRVREARSSGRNEMRVEMLERRRGPMPLLVCKM